MEIHPFNSGQSRPKREFINKLINVLMLLNSVRLHFSLSFSFLFNNKKIMDDDDDDVERSGTFP